MIFVLLTILSSTGIFAVFRFVDRYNISTFSVIIINYFAAVAIGGVFILTHHQNIVMPGKATLFTAVLIGILFIVMFYVIGMSTQKAGITPTTVAAKMSVVIPITFSILIDPTDSIDLMKLSGILIALPALLLTIYKPGKVKNISEGFYLPLILFAGMGAVDSMVKFAQEAFVKTNSELLFSTLVFFFAAISGVFGATLQKRKFSEFSDKKVLAWGALLGVFNFGSIFFILKALNFQMPTGERLDGSVVFAVTNIGIVLLSVFTGFLIFRERPMAINWIGVVFSVMAIFILANW